MSTEIISADLAREKMKELFTVEEKANVDKLIAMGEFDQIAAVVSIETPEQERILQRYINLVRPKPEAEGSTVRAEMEAAEQRGETIDSPEAEASWQKRLDEEAAAKQAANTELDSSEKDTRTKKDIIAELEAAGIEHDPSLKKAELFDLLNASAEKQPE